MGNKGLRYAMRDGFVGLKRHPMVLLVAITTMFMMLSMLGAYVLFALNANNLLKQAGETPPVEVQFVVGVNPDNVVNLAEQFADNENIVEYKVMSPQDNFEEFKSLMEKEELFDEFDYTQHIPWSILLRLAEPKLGAEFRAEVMNYPGVYDVMMETSLMKTLQAAIQSVSALSAAVLAVLLFVCILVINNMIRVIALSRAGELSIMKTMGATDLYIRIPFVVEGVFVSLVSSILGLLLLFSLYNFLLKSCATGFIAEGLLPLRTVALPLIIVVVLFALLVGVVTSYLSVKKHIQV